MSRIIFRLSVVMALLLSLSGCSGNLLSGYTINIKEKYDAKTFNEGKKAVVVFKVTQHLDESFFYKAQDVRLDYKLRMLTSGEVITDSKIATHYNKDYSTAIKMLDPGIYYIDYLALLPEGNVTSWYPKGIKSLQNDQYLILIGAFEVKAGQVVYLGNLNLGTKGALPLKIRNEIDQAKADLSKAGHQDLADKLTLQPTYTSGSLIIRHNQKFTFISKEQLDKQLNDLIQKIGN